VSAQPLQIAVQAHPSLDVRAFITRFASSLQALPSPEWLTSLLAPGAASPLATPDDVVRACIRDVLRHGGYKPTGRGKPSSEYLVRAAQEGALRSINLAVDACNAVSLHSGLPISVIDLGRVQPPLRVVSGAAGDRYVFNAGGQVIDVAGLPCLFDPSGPCANAVKDAQRTKTSDETRATLSLIWSAHELSARSDAALRFYRDLLERAGATLEDVAAIAASAA
jgi:DNA/RNA-binding domain of Phe-tRNA-synthetase-like protein